MIIDRKKLATIMVEQDVNVRIVCKKARIMPYMLSLARNGKRELRDVTIAKIAMALGVDIADIVTDESSVPTSISVPTHSKPAAPKSPSPAWRTDFEVYRAEGWEAVKALTNDVDWVRKMGQYHPRSDILLSIEKSWNTFWGTEEGWENKKKNKTNKINWKNTIARTLQYSLVPKVNPYAGGGY
jgi:hypothetical protein